MTPYELIYNRFLQKVTDWKMLSLNDTDLREMWVGWLRSAVAKQKIFDHDLTFDDENLSFEEDLSEIEIEILAVGMCIEWLEPQVNSVINTLQLFSDSEVKFYSQANHLSELRDRLREMQIERKKLVRDYQYNNFARNGA